MPKGVYMRTGFHRELNVTWDTDQDDFVIALCKTTESYGEIMKKFNARFPHAMKTRNAILGRAQRQGWSLNKPKPPGYTQTAGANQTRKEKYDRTITVRKLEGTFERMKHKPLVPVVFKKAEAVLRDESDPGETRKGRPRKLSANDPKLKERKKGTLPCIIEEQPLTSMAVAECEGGCMWPTSEDIACMEVCGAAATIGSYCARHAQAAFRVMPTMKRNRVRLKEDVEHARRVDGSQYRDRLDPDGAWLNAQMMALDEVTVETEDDGISPLLIPFFMEKLS